MLLAVSPAERFWRGCPRLEGIIDMWQSPEHRREAAQQAGRQALEGVECAPGVANAKNREAMLAGDAGQPNIGLSEVRLNALQVARCANGGQPQACSPFERQAGRI